MVSTDLQKRVTEALEYDPRINAFEIGVTATPEGVVTLAGKVASHPQRLLAERAAKHVYGVRGVANELEVELVGPRPDSDIADAVVKRLQDEVTVPADRIQVTVSEGNVRMEGDVDQYYQKEDAERAVAWIRGVTDVDNRIQVKAPAKPDPKVVETRVKDALMRNAALDARHIDVRTYDGTLVLEGTVRSWAEVEQAVDAAWAAPGVDMVENHLHVSG